MSIDFSNRAHELREQLDAIRNDMEELWLAATDRRERWETGLQHVDKAMGELQAIAGGADFLEEGHA